MIEERKRLLSDFETRVRHLVYVNEQQKQEIVKLKELLESEKEERKKLLEEIDNLRKNYINFQTAAAISGNGNELKKAKLRLSRLVREIDECIALLNE